MKKLFVIALAVLIVLGLMVLPAVALPEAINTYEVTATVKPYIMTGSVYPINLGNVEGPSFEVAISGPGAITVGMELLGKPAGTVEISGYTKAMAYANCPLTVSIQGSSLSREETGDNAVGTDELNTIWNFVAVVNGDPSKVGNDTSPQPLTFSFDETPHNGQVAAYLAVGVDGPDADINPDQVANLSPDAGEYTAIFTVTYAAAI